MNSDQTRKLEVVIVILAVISGIIATTLLRGETEMNKDSTQFNGKWTRPDDSVLRKNLTEMEYAVTQKCGTEPPFKNKYWNNKQEGLYVDVVSGEPLFSSRDKFDSGTGWPSFTRPLNDKAVTQHTDRRYGITRTEVRSRHADSHLGHVFDDGPQPGGLRYCLNSSAMEFIPREELAARGYKDYEYLFEKGSDTIATATFGAGCFWGVEEALRKVDGVVDTAVGFMGGKTENPSYKSVCTGRTGHAEVVQVKYNPKTVSYGDLLKVFWNIHDPTTLDRQGWDVGNQYRSVVFYQNPEQREEALDYRKELEKEKKFKNRIVTAVEPATTFYRAEEYHQQYYEKKTRHRKAQ